MSLVPLSTIYNFVPSLLNVKSAIVMLVPNCSRRISPTAVVCALSVNSSPSATTETELVARTTRLISSPAGTRSTSVPSIRRLSCPETRSSASRIMPIVGLPAIPVKALQVSSSVKVCERSVSSSSLIPRVLVAAHAKPEAPRTSTSPRTPLEPVAS